MDPHTKQRIKDQLATVQDLLESRIAALAELGPHSRADLAAEIADLARAQRELVVTLGRQDQVDCIVEPKDWMGAGHPSVDTREIDGVRYVRFPAHEWRCPNCGDARALKVTEPPAHQPRLDADPAYYLADIEIMCNNCRWVGTPLAAVSLLTAE